MLRKPGVEWLEPPDGAADPVGQRRAIELDTMPRENLALAVKRQVIAVLGGQDMSEQGRAGKPLGDRPLGGRCLMNGAAGPAAIAWTANTDDPKPCRHIVEHLAYGSLASTLPRSPLRSSKPSCSWSSSSRSARRPNWLRCSLRMMSLSRSISAWASLRLARSAASVRTISCRVVTS